MDHEATPSGAEITTPAPGTIDEAAQKLSGLFGAKPDKPKKEEKEEPETDSEPAAEAEAETQEEEERQEPEGKEEEQPNEDEARPLTSLEDIEQALGVDRDALMQISIKTKVDGVEQDATLAQILKGYQLESHVNRKSMEVSDLKKEVEKHKETFETEKQQKLSQLEQAATVAHELLLGEFKAIDWAKLEKDDPIEYLTKKDQFQKYNGNLNQIFSVIQQDKARAVEAQQSKLKEYVKDQQNKLSAKLPGWTDEKVRSKEYAELTGFLKTELGVTKEELDTILDHRFYELAYDARRYRELMKKNPKVENKDRKTPTFVKAGAPKGEQRGVAQVSDLKRNHGKQKSLDSAANLINALAKPKR
jgi:hypothetical protein